MSHNDLFRLFVYGTLKRGYWNHEAFCSEAISIQEATVRGRLYELPSGIPVLRVPDSDILAVGTLDPLADVATQERTPADPIVDAVRDETDWHMIRGEIITLGDPQMSLPPIDQLEGFRGMHSTYRRVLVPAATGGSVLSVWCYVGCGSLIRNARPTNKTQWP
jgi:gamma-glutamylcyclotransferase (GGCT)/AIG2-like uncharacterized protein YtfP